MWMLLRELVANQIRANGPESAQVENLAKILLKAPIADQMQTSPFNL